MGTLAKRTSTSHINAANSIGVVLVDPSGSTPFGTTAALPSRIQDGTGTGLAVVTSTGADAVATSGNGLHTRAFTYAFNGTTWDRLKTATPNNVSQGATGFLGVAPMLWNGAVQFRAWASAEGYGDNLDGAPVAATAGYVYNGATVDRVRNNTDIQLLASAARTTTQTSADLINYNAEALIVVLDMTVVGTGSVTVTIDMKDTTSGKYINLLTGAAITTNSTNRYRVGPNLAAVANSVAQDYLPRVFRIVVTANNANAATYSVGYHLVKAAQ